MKHFDSLHHRDQCIGFFLIFCSGRRRNDMREENVGVDNQGYAERNGNQNSVATTEKIELVNVGFI